LIERIECDPPWFVEAKFADVPESLWQRIEPLIPRSGRNREAGGLPWLRVVMAGIVYRLKPPKFFCTRRRRPLPCRARRRRVRHKGGGKARAGSARSRAQAGHAARYRDRRSARRLPSTRARAEQAGGGQHYEEYHPYGSTAFHAASAASEVSAKRYRYTSKERDEETGFYYHGARYYVPWLGRWTAADPLEFTDGINLYRYVHDNPVVMIDPAGTQAAPVVTPGTPAPTGPAVKTALERAAARWGTAKLLTEAALKAAPAAAPAAEALAGAALVQAAAQVAAYALIAHLYATRAGSIARYGNPYGLPADDIAFPLQRYERERRRHAEPKEDAYPGSDVLPEPAADRKEDDKKPQKLGRIYVTYTKYNERTKLYYSGRTSAVVDLTKPLRPQADPCRGSTG
jgi:RHS repeat-associated protein